MERYRQARNDCEMRNVDTLLDSLEAVAERSQPVIAMSFEACDGVFRSKKYLNYSQSVSANLRGPARPVDHADRASVGARLFASYRNLSTTLRHWRLRFTEQSLLLWMWMWQVG